MRSGWRFWAAQAAALLAMLAFAGAMSASRFSPTALMFVAPGAILLGAHWLAAKWLGAAQASQEVFRNALVSAVLFAGGVGLLMGMGSYFLEPDKHMTAVGGLAAAAFCWLITAIVIAVPLAAYYALFLAFRETWRFFFPRSATRGRLNEGGVLLAALASLAALSLEGVPGGYDFSREDEASASLFIAAPPAAVWAAIGKASSPDLPLPFWLETLPRPVGVIDEGDALGSRRIVHFKGREGEGDLVLEVASRAEDSITWAVAVDTTPLAGWARGRSVAFRVEAAPGGTHLAVTARYERLLAPAWFFKPYMRAVIGSAMQVLAQDKRDRALAIAAKGRS